MMKAFDLLSVVFFFLPAITQAGAYPKVDADIEAYDQKISQMKRDPQKKNASIFTPEEAKQKLKQLVELDRFTRTYWNLSYNKNYTPAEHADFKEQFIRRIKKIDADNRLALKELLTQHGWFKISKFGKDADQSAWLLVQHADEDPDFQQRVLGILEKLYRVHETDPANYAYLYDRVTTSPLKPELRKPQRYGTQGRCTGPGEWAPYPIEDPANLDRRRKEVGLGPASEYLKGFKEICKDAE